MSESVPYVGWNLEKIYVGKVYCKIFDFCNDYCDLADHLFREIGIQSSA